MIKNLIQKNKVLLRILTGACVLAMLFSGCAKPFINPTFTQPDFSIDKLKGAKSQLATSQLVNVVEFKKSFESEFGTSDSLARFLTQSILDSLKSGAPEVSVKAAPLQFAGSLDFNGRMSDDVAKADTFFRQTDAKYVLYIKNITVGNSVTTTPGTMMPMAGGGMMMTGGGSSESCVITYDVEIWDVTDASKKASFKTTGQAGVLFFAYQTALENAIMNSVEHLVSYLKEGKTDFVN